MPFFHSCLKNWCPNIGTPLSVWASSVADSCGTVGPDAPATAAATATGTGTGAVATGAGASKTSSVATGTGASSSQNGAVSAYGGMSGGLVEKVLPMVAAVVGLGMGMGAVLL